MTAKRPGHGHFGPGTPGRCPAIATLLAARDKVVSRLYGVLGRDGPVRIRVGEPFRGCGSLSWSAV